LKQELPASWTDEEENDEQEFNLKSYPTKKKQ
jgi:hypothetical protein